MGNACVRQAGRGCLPVASCESRELAVEVGLSAGRAQHRHRLRRRGGRGAGGASRHRPHLLHRLAPTPARWCSRPRRHAPLPGDAGARRQVAADRLRRRRPRRGACRSSSTPSCRTPGQTCSAGSRLLVERAVYDDVRRALAERFTALRVGPSDMDLDCGPLINRASRARVEGFLARARSDGLTRGRAGQDRAEHAARRLLRGADAVRRRAAAPRPRRRTRSSARCWPRCRSRARKRRSRSPTAPSTASSPACGRATARARCASPGRSRPARSSSTITAPAAASSCPSAACKPLRLRPREGLRGAVLVQHRQDRRRQARLSTRGHVPCDSRTRWRSSPAAARASAKGSRGASRRKGPR